MTVNPIRSDIFLRQLALLLLHGDSIFKIHSNQKSVWGEYNL